MRDSKKKLSLLSRWKEKKGMQDHSELKPVPKDMPIPLSREQQRLWFLQQLHPDNSFYNYSELYRLSGNLQVRLLEQSIRCIEENHDILRSNFEVHEGIPTVRVIPKATPTFCYYDFSDETIEVANEKASEIVHKASRYVFDLSSERLIRSVVIKISKDNFLFLIAMHHIITDKWSMRVFRDELIQNYTTLLAGKTPVKHVSDIQYSSYAQWQQDQKINTQHLAYWKEKLSGEIPVLNLPTDFSKRMQPRYAGTFHKQSYDDQTAETFFDLCKKLEVTPYILMLSVYYALLQKYSGQEDIFIGTPITKRDDVALEKLIGFFNDTLVLRTKVTKTLSFSQLVQDVKQTTLDAFSNKDISFDTLVKELKPNRSLSINPFFQVMFLYHAVPETPSLGDNIQIDYEPYDAGVSKFDLTLYISDDQGDLTSLMEYDTDLFEASTIARMHTHFKVLLQYCIQNPNALLSEIPMQVPEEISYYSAFQNPSYTLPKTPVGIHEIIEQQALLYPDRIAVQYKKQSLTYKSLNDKAAQVAKALIKDGLTVNDIVGLCIERSHKVIIGLLGILKAGGAYLPLDPSYPVDRISYILENTNAAAILTEEHLLTDVEQDSIRTYGIDSLLDEFDMDKETILPKVKDTDLAYVIYTSGSTGNPKGVPITHKNIINSTLSRTNFYDQDPSAFLLMSSISFDSSKVGVFWSLCFGGTLIISEKHLEQDLDKMTDIIDKYKVSHTLMLPSLYTNLIEYGDIARLSSLHTVMVAGESCTTTLVQKHFESLPNVHLYNEYGPTEATVWCIAHKVRPTDAQQRSVPIGIPAANALIYILNDTLEKVPFGSIGELYVGGVGLTTGYINHVEGAFVKNPFSSSSERLYKTGDLARFRGDGTIEFLGRKDKQVKVRGYRIELDEIEQVLQASDHITQAAVTIVTDSNPDISEENIEHNTKELAQWMEAHLSEEEITSWVTSIEHLEQEEIKYMIDQLVETV